MPQPSSERARTAQHAGVCEARASENPSKSLKFRAVETVEAISSHFILTAFQARSVLRVGDLVRRLKYGFPGTSDTAGPVLNRKNLNRQHFVQDKSRVLAFGRGSYFICLLIAFTRRQAWRTRGIHARLMNGTFMVIPYWPPST